MRSERRACELVGICRSVMRYQAKAKDDDPLRRRLRELAVQYPRYGYQTLHPILKREGWVINQKRTYRIYRQEQLQVPRPRGKKLPRRRCFRRQRATRPNQCWSMDFMSDQLANGRRFRVLNIVDHYTRECKGQIVDFSISGLRLSLFLDSCSLLPEEIVVDNGPELTSKALFFWSEKTGVRLRFIDPGKPIQNAFVESFNARFRDTCLNEYWFTSLADARQTIESWRQHYNRERPHSALQYRTPEEVRQEWEEANGKDGSLGASENSPSFPLFQRPEDDKLSLSEWS